MAKPAMPELKKYMGKRLLVQMNGNRKITGVLRGYDPFMNVVLDDVLDETVPNAREELGMVVLRGNSVVMVEALERVQLE